MILTLGFSNPGAVIPRTEHSLQTGEIQTKITFDDAHVSIRLKTYPSHGDQSFERIQQRRKKPPEERSLLQPLLLSYILVLSLHSKSTHTFSCSYSLLMANISLPHPNHFCILRPIQRNITGSIFVTGWGL